MGKTESFGWKPTKYGYAAARTCMLGCTRVLHVLCIQMASFVRDVQSELRTPEGEEKIRSLMSQMENQSFAARIGTMMKNMQEAEVYTMTRAQGDTHITLTATTA